MYARCLSRRNQLEMREYKCAVAVAVVFFVFLKPIELLLVATTFRLLPTAAAAAAATADEAEL